MITGINVTPLVDVTLVLLVIMMVAAPLIAAERGVAMVLPRMQSADAKVDALISVELLADGTMLVNGERFDSFAELRRRASGLSAQRAVIRADVAVRHGQVMGALDAINTAGISKISFAAVQPQP